MHGAELMVAAGQEAAQERFQAREIVRDDQQDGQSRLSSVRDGHKADFNPVSHECDLVLTDDNPRSRLLDEIDLESDLHLGQAFRRAPGEQERADFSWNEVCLFLERGFHSPRRRVRMMP